MSRRKKRGAQLWVRWMDTRQGGKLTSVRHGPVSLAWSPDGRWLAFTMFVPEDEAPSATMPAKPKAPNGRRRRACYTHAVYRSDDEGYLEPGHAQLFVLPAEGGTPRTLTSGHVRSRISGLDARTASRFSSRRIASRRRDRAGGHGGLRGRRCADGAMHAADAAQRPGQ
jgi:Tol biopolymer transport system component